MEFVSTLVAPLVDWLAAHFPQARLVVAGGAVRDWVRGQAVKDIDLEVLGVGEEALAAALPWPRRAVGRSFSHWLVELEPGHWLELSVEPEAVDASLDEHWRRLARRRDFSCNAMAWDLREQRLLDPFQGQSDIARGLLRQVDAASLDNDPLRVFRAAQFCARFNWSLDAETERSIRRVLPALSGLAPERVTREWEKLFRLASRPSRAVELLNRWGVIEQCYPELDALHDCPQDPIYHPEGDVWIHTLMVLDQAARLCTAHGLQAEERIPVLLGALLHDLGKPATTVSENGRVSAHGHERAGVEPASRWLERHCFGEHIGQAALDCVSEHMRPNLLDREIEAGKLSPSQQFNALRRLVRDLQAISFEHFMILCEADRLGRGVPAAEWAGGERLRQLYRSRPPAVVQPQLLQGRDLLALGVAPGQGMGVWLRRVEQARDEGLFEEREQALEWLRRQLEPGHDEPAGRAGPGPQPDAF